ncbi:MAG: acylneuraminate cytidylyltransferase family protein [Alphaproteobacteria bacterium]|nr:acylneuraminate cytidylyltransferase family protein [Alphaproteobacteria bacterium]
MPLYDKSGQRRSVVGLIPARGGSKGLPRKNVLPIAGKPLIGYVIEAAQASRLLDLVVVSTDDEEIAKVARSFGVRVIDRPAEFATDTAPIDLALRHVVSVLEREGHAVDVVVWLQANVPTTSPEVIDQAVSLMLEEDCDSVQTVVPFQIPPQWAWRLDGNRLLPLEGCYKYTVRRQDAVEAYHLDGAINVLKRTILMNTEGQQGQAYFGTDRRALVQSPHSNIEVDGQVDYDYACYLFERRQFK